MSQASLARLRRYGIDPKKSLGQNFLVDETYLDRIVAARVDRDRRYALRNADFAVHFPHGVTERRILNGGGEIRKVLTDIFGINVPDWPEIDETFERLASTVSLSR